MAIEVRGVKELSARLLAMTESLDRPEAFRVMLLAARKVRDAAKTRAPRRENKLRKAITALPAPKRSGLGPAAFARVNLFKGATVAPHGHLVEFGTKTRRPKRGKFLVFRDERDFGLKGWKTGDLVFVRLVRPMKAQPFFRPAVESAGPAALQAATNEVQKILEKS